MRTLCFTLGLLLLLTVCCCDAMPQEVRLSGGPEGCCFVFYEQRLQRARVASITKTPIRCPTQGFIVQTDNGRQICISQTSQWALDLYNRCILGDATVENERCIIV